jgi:hypothetical protein
VSGRLKQIWSGFEGVTTRHLTGGGVDRIETRSRRDYDASISAPVADHSVPSPAETAFAALRHRLSAAEQRQARREEKASRKSGARAMAAPPAPLSPQMPADAAPEAVQDLVRGLRATSFRTDRSYADYPALAQSKSAGTGRKKIFGIF